MKTPGIRGIAVAAMLALFGLSRPAGAAPIIEVDLDPGTPGTQFTRTVTVGTTFTVDILLLDDGSPVTPVMFDTVIVETSFNNAGVVLGPGPTGPVAGGLAGVGPAGDVFGALAPVAPGSPLTAGPSFPLATFLSGSGAIGMLFLPPVAVAPGPPVSIYSFDFVALAPGTSTVFAAGSPPGSPELALFGAGPPVGFGPAGVTVVPEPASLLIFGSGLAGLMLFGRRSRRRRQTAA